MSFDGASVRRKMTLTPFLNLLNGLTECDDTDHRHIYFDSASFGTKFKAFCNLGAEWEAKYKLRTFLDAK